MKIFVSGLPGCGKTTLLKKLYEILKEKFNVDGFITEEIRENKKRVGFKIFLLKLKKEFLFASKEIKSNVCYAGYYLDLNSFENAIDLIDLNSQILIIDEIGKMEMESKKFQQFISKILNSNKTIIASVHRNLLNLVKNKGKVYWLNEENRNKIFEEIKQLIMGG